MKLEDLGSDLVELRHKIDNNPDLLLVKAKMIETKAKMERDVMRAIRHGTE